MDGLEVAREARRSSTVPIILLTARADEVDRVVGLELGADDYVAKPFSPRELVARVRAVLRRSPGGELAAGKADGALASGDVALDLRKRSATVAGRSVSLTAIQFDILCLLMREPGRVWTRLEILERAVGACYEGYERTIDAHIKNIRKVIGDDSENPKYIGTMRGVGYRSSERPDAA